MTNLIVCRDLLWIDTAVRTTNGVVLQDSCNIIRLPTLLPIKWNGSADAVDNIWGYVVLANLRESWAIGPRFIHEMNANDGDVACIMRDIGNVVGLVDVAVPTAIIVLLGETHRYMIRFGKNAGMSRYAYDDKAASYNGSVGDFMDYGNPVAAFLATYVENPHLSGLVYQWAIAPGIRDCCTVAIWDFSDPVENAKRFADPAFMRRSPPSYFFRSALGKELAAMGIIGVQKGVE